MDDRRRHTRIQTNDRRFSGAFRMADGTVREFQMTARNISCGGMALLFDQEAEPEARIEVVLPKKDGEMVGVAGQVRSCRNLGFIIHELGIEFDEPLDEETFAKLAVIPQ